MVVLAGFPYRLAGSGGDSPGFGFLARMLIHGHVRALLDKALLVISVYS
jgi:hypothetical protein